MSDILNVAFWILGASLGVAVLAMIAFICWTLWVFRDQENEDFHK